MTNIIYYDSRHYQLHPVQEKPKYTFSIGTTTKKHLFSRFFRGYIQSFFIICNIMLYPIQLKTFQGKTFSNVQHFSCKHACKSRGCPQPICIARKLELDITRLSVAQNFGWQIKRFRKTLDVTARPHKLNRKAPPTDVTCTSSRVAAVAGRHVTPPCDSM